MAFTPGQLIQESHAPTPVTEDVPPPVFTPKPGPGARSHNAYLQVQQALSGQPLVTVDETNAPDAVSTASKLSGHTDPVKVGRLAAVLSRYADSTMDVEPAGRLAAAQIDWAKAATAFRQKKADPDMKATFDRLMADPQTVSDDEAVNLSDFVRRFGDLTSEVYSKDLEFDPTAGIDEVENTPLGPVVHITQRHHQSKPMRSAYSTVPNRLPYVTGGSEGVFVTSDGLVGVTAPAASADKFRHLYPAIEREDGISLWAPRTPLVIRDVTQHVTGLDLQMEGHQVEQWSAIAFDGRHPGQRPGMTFLVDVADRAPVAKIVAELGDLMDPKQAAVVVSVEDGDRAARRVRRVGLKLGEDVRPHEALKELEWRGAQVAAIYANGKPMKGWSAAAEHTLTDGVVSTIVRYQGTPSGADHRAVWLPTPVAEALPKVTPRLTNATGQLMPPADLLPLKGKVIQGSADDLLPAVRSLQLYRLLGNDPHIEIEHKGRKLRLTGVK